MRINIITILLLGILLLAHGVPGIAQPRVVMIVIDRITPDDISSGKMPALKKLADQGGVAVMNANGWGRRGPEATYATIGAGSRSVGDFMASQAYDASETLENEGLAGDAFRRMSGIRPGFESVVSFSPPILMRENEKAMSLAVPGSLGGALHRKGYRTGIIGNSDDIENPNRLAAVIAMDEYGLVDKGAVSSRMADVDPDAPLGLRTDTKALLEAYRHFADKTDFMVIETGDMTRLERSRLETILTAFELQRESALARTDSLLNSLLQEINLTKTLVIVVAPCPPVPEGMWDTLPPVVLAGKGISPGLLTTASTHTRGLITASDLAPTVLKAFKIPLSPTMDGGTIQVVEGDWQRDVPALNTWATLNYRVRVPIMVFSAVLVVLSMSLVVVSLAFPHMLPARALALARVGLLATMAIPSAALVPPLVTITDPVIYYAAWVAALIVIPAIAMLVSRGKWNPSLILLAASAVVILLDTLTGKSLSSRSPLAACPITGIRYYGLGNEYMGVLVGSVLTSSAFLFSRGQLLKGYHFAVIILIFALVVSVIGAPNLGANVGGVLTAVPGMGLLLLSIAGYKTERRQKVLLFVGSLCVVAFFALVDTLREPLQQSHIGQTVVGIHRNGIGLIMNIAFRKVQMNLGLITGPAGKAVIFSLVPAFALWVYVLRTRAQAVLEENQWLKHAGRASALSIPIALFFNDSGIVPAAIIAAAVVSPWLWLMLDGGKNENSSA